MKVVVLTDLHGKRAVMPAIDRLLSKYKIGAVLMLGDLCNRNDKHALLYALDFINLITDKYKLPLYLIHGNNEPDSVKLLYQQKNISVHFNPKTLSTSDPASKVRSEVEIIGVGFGDAFPTDPQFAKDKILLTHEPPRINTIREMAKVNLPHSPIIHFAGHLHNIAKIWKLNKTLLVQVPSAMLSRCVIFDASTKAVDFLNF